MPPSHRRLCMDIDQKFEIIIEHVIDIKTEQARQGGQIDHNTKDLKDHIEGVVQNRGRIEVLEKDKVRKKAIVKFSCVIASVGAGIAAIFSAVTKYF